MGSEFRDHCIDPGQVSDQAAAKPVAEPLLEPDIAERGASEAEPDPEKERAIMRWALALPMPGRHRLVLLALLTFMDPESQKASPSLRQLTERVGTLRSDTVQMAMAD